MPLVDRRLRRMALLLAAGAALLLGLALASTLIAARAQATFDEVVRDRELRRAASALLTALREVEIGSRGFLVTGDPDFLQPYEEALAALPDLKADLARRAAASDVDVGADLDGLDALVEERLALARAGIALEGTGDREALLAGERRGKAAMDELRARLDGLLDRTASDFEALLAAQGSLSRWSLAGTILAALATIAVVGLAFAAAARQVRALRGAEEELRGANAGLEERVAERTERLDRANQEVQRFATVVTHDLRAPLVNVMGFTSELEESLGAIQAYVLHDGAEPLSEQVIREARQAAAEDLPEALGFIRASTRKMDGLINAILRLSRDGRRELRAEAIDLAALVTQALAAVAHQVAEGGGEAEVDARARTLVSDRLSVEQALGNLLDNAVKYASPGRPLRLKVRTRAGAPGRVLIEVEDNGRGVAEADRERVFEPFRRAGRLDRPGEGIGLAHVRGLVRNLGGDVALRSREGEGSVFTIDLPADLRRARGPVAGAGAARTQAAKTQAGGAA